MYVYIFMIIIMVLCWHCIYSFLLFFIILVLDFIVIFSVLTVISEEEMGLNSAYINTEETVKYYFNIL